MFQSMLEATDNLDEAELQRDVTVHFGGKPFKTDPLMYHITHSGK